MNINIGEKIKNYRKIKELTQEQLADSLNISFQAVSKWERGDAYPDVEMIPRIAYFFNTTTDDLLCVDQVKTEEEIKDYLDRHSKLCNVGDVQGGLALMREANAKYPGNYNLMRMLSFAIGWTKYQGNEEEDKKACEEIIELSEKILAECTDNGIRFSIIQGLCFSLGELGQKDKAIEIVNKELPEIVLSKNIMLTHLLDGDKLIKQNQINLDIFLNSSIEIMCRLARDFEPDAKLAVYENVLKMYEFIYTDGDYHIHHINVKNRYMDIADIYLDKKDYEKTLAYMEKAVEHTVAYDNLPASTIHTSPLINKLEYNGIWKNHKVNQCWLFLQSMSNSKYDVIRDNDCFKSMLSVLEKYVRDDI